MCFLWVFFLRMMIIMSRMMRMITTAPTNENRCRYTYKWLYKKRSLILKILTLRHSILEYCKHTITIRYSALYHVAQNTVDQTHNYTEINILLLPISYLMTVLLTNNRTYDKSEATLGFCSSSTRWVIYGSF